MPKRPKLSEYGDFLPENIHHRLFIERGAEELTQNQFEEVMERVASFDLSDDEHYCIAQLLVHIASIRVRLEWSKISDKALVSKELFEKLETLGYTGEQVRDFLTVIYIHLNGAVDAKRAAVAAAAGKADD